MKIKQILLFIWLFFLSSFSSVSAVHLNDVEQSNIFWELNQAVTVSVEDHSRTPKVLSLEDIPSEYISLSDNNIGLSLSYIGQCKTLFSPYLSRPYLGTHSGLSPPFS
ncbi:hypothetical protein M902_0970 [Bacteriovorax sp. BAL6_X]|uniref:hypothetical protein n=1 Tax=Bacteriovorax sp. BAL6_X TaxID=1201290 RepID=UPI000385E71C|nr:hypothetical protein [Bacteriovorax sp. BAL6_X]EPZ49333.1 hypothetical protein M902_0970 [Bacteriovorax sp. BAL6_X]